MKFSIIIPTYNRANQLKKAIESVLKQSFKDWELIVVDDGSTDNTKEIVYNYKNERIKYHYQENKERSAARNNGIKNATGEWICFLDSDDYFEPDYLFQINSFSNQLNTDCILIGHKKYWKKVDKIIEYEAVTYKNNIVLEFCQKAKPIATWEVISKKNVFENYLFDERFNVWEDTHLYYRILSNHKYEILNTQCYVQVLNDGSGMFEAEEKLDFKMIHTYFEAITDLFKYRFEDLKINRQQSIEILQKYLHLKNQMFFYRGYTQKDYIGTKKILKIAMKNKPFWGDPLYYIKSFFKLALIKFK